MKTVAFTLLFALAAAAHAADTLRADIDRGNQEWVDGMKARNAKLIVAAYATDAVNCSAKGECQSGHDAIEQFFAARLAGLKQDVVSGKVTSAKTVRDGDLAYEWGSASVTFADGKTFGGKYLTVWRHDADGKWRILRNLALP